MSTAAEVRAQIAARLSGLGTLARESAEPTTSIRGEAHSPVHLEYAVGLPEQSYTARNRLCSAEVEIVIAYHLPPKDRVTGYDAALDLCDSVTAALQMSDWGALNPRLAAITPLGVRREPGIDGWVWITITLTAIYALT